MPRLSCFNANLIKTYGYSPYFPEFASVSFKKNFLSFYNCFYFFSLSRTRNTRIESCNSNLFDCEQFDLFTSFKIKIAYETLPSGYTAISTSNRMQFHYIACQENFYDTSKLLSSVVVTEDLIVKPFVLSTPLPSSSFCHIIAGTKLSNTSEILNILALCKITFHKWFAQMTCCSACSR